MISRRSADIVIAAAAWTAFIWSFRLWNMIGEGHSVGFLLVHAAIAGVSIAFAVALFVIGRSARRAPAPGAIGDGARGAPSPTE